MGLVGPRPSLLTVILITFLSDCDLERLAVPTVGNKQPIRVKARVSD